MNRLDKILLYAMVSELESHGAQDARRANKIWIYFDNNKEDGFATCKTCQQRLKNNRSFNLRQHLRKLHNIDLEAKPEELPHYSPQPYDESQIKEMLKVAKRRMLEDQEMVAKRARRRLPIELEKFTMINAIMSLIVQDGLPLKILDSKYMKALLNPICESMSDLGGKDFNITKHRCYQALDSVADYIRKGFAKDLNWRLLSLVFESFLGSQPDVRCVIAQYVDKGQVAAHILEEKPTTSDSNNGDNSAITSEFLDDKDAFLNEFLSQDIPIRYTTVNDAHVKIEKFKLSFQQVDTNVLKFWQEQNFSETELCMLGSVCFGADCIAALPLFEQHPLSIENFDDYDFEEDEDNSNSKSPST
uniref:BED-type domain-containing protein n=1 Tax=Glossina brevipalpis TaxID=37001 RepID=A0A1A9WBG6_9MUSC